MTDANIKNAIDIASNKYIIFIADMYGNNKYTHDRNEAKIWATECKANPLQGRIRSNAALNTFIKEVNERYIGNPSKIAVVGFCFGGGNALELARSGADVQAVICIHGDLVSQNPTIHKLKQHILILHGSLDLTTPLKDRLIFEKEMDDSKSKWQMNVYGGVYHNFTEKGENIPTVSVYDYDIAQQSIISMNKFIEHVFLYEYKM